MSHDRTALEALKHRYRVAVCVALACYAERGLGFRFHSESGDEGRLRLTFELDEPAGYEEALSEVLDTADGRGPSDHGAGSPRAALSAKREGPAVCRASCVHASVGRGDTI